MNQLNFTTQYYFPGRFVWIIASPLAAIAFLGGHLYWLCALAILIGFIAITTRYGVIVDLNSKKYQDYIWVCGFKIGPWVSFSKIQYVFIKDYKIQQRFNSRVNSATFSHNEFRGFIKFSEQEKIHIITRKNYEALAGELKTLAQKLNVGLIDYSFGNRKELL